MASITKLMQYYPRHISNIKVLSVCKYSNKTTSEADNVEKPSNESKKSESKRLSEFRKKLRETTPIEDLGEQTLHASQQKEDALPPWPNNTNPHTGEINGPRGPEPTRYGDWERKGRCSDF